MLRALQQIQPSFFTDHAAGRQCLVPAAQLSLDNMRYLSPGVVRAAGHLWQAWMEHWLRGCWALASITAPAAKSLLKGWQDKDADVDPALAGLADAQIWQWGCLNVVVTMLMATTVRQAATTSVSPSTTSSSSSSSSSSDAALARHQHSSQPSASSVSGEWLPATLAPSMPAAYRNVLEQLGCSREVGLWMAVLMADMKQVFPSSPLEGSAFLYGKVHKVVV